MKENMKRSGLTVLDTQLSVSGNHAFPIMHHLYGWLFQRIQNVKCESRSKTKTKQLVYNPLKGNDEL